VASDQSPVRTKALDLSWGFGLLLLAVHWLLTTGYCFLLTGPL
jgi:hypothetical protein